MTDDPNKQQHDPKQSNEQGGQQHGQQSGQQQQRKPSDISQKRPAQGGTDVEQDQERDQQGGQRRAS